MSGPIATLCAEMAARWATREYPTPLLYGYNEVARTRELDAFLMGNGRIVYHYGAYSAPDAAAGQVKNSHPHVKSNGRTVATSAAIFTVHCYGYDQAYSDIGAPGAQAAHDDHAWRLHEMFFSVLQWVTSKNRWYNELGSAILVRDPEQKRLGELLRCEFVLNIAIRADPIYPIQYPETKPTGLVKPSEGDPVNILEVP